MSGVEHSERLKCDWCGHVALYLRQELLSMCKACHSRTAIRMDWPSTEEIEREVSKLNEAKHTQLEDENK